MTEINYVGKMIRNIVVIRHKDYKLPSKTKLPLEFGINGQILIFFEVFVIVILRTEKKNRPKYIIKGF